MSRPLIIAACLSLLSSVSAHAGKFPFPVAADGTTNITDCGKVDASFRNECISRARPLTGAQIYTKTAPKVAASVKTAPAVKPAKSLPAIATVAPKGPRGFKIAKDGTTNIYDCAHARADLRDVCISRSRPLTGKQLAKFEKKPVLSAAKVVKAPAVVLPHNDVLVPKVAAVAKTPGKGFAVARDGTTNIADCGKANPDYRNECISRARPVKGADLYRAAKSRS